MSAWSEGLFYFTGELRWFREVIWCFQRFVYHISSLGSLLRSQISISMHFNHFCKLRVLLSKVTYIVSTNISPGVWNETYRQQRRKYWQTSFCIKKYKNKHFFSIFLTSKATTTSNKHISTYILKYNSYIRCIIWQMVDHDHISTINWKYWNMFLMEW